jgi:hypothetical protein
MATPEEIIVQTLRQRKSPEQEVFDKNRQADGFNAIPDRPYLESFVNALNNPAGEFFGGGLKNLADKWSWDRKGDYGDFAMAAMDVPVQGVFQKAALPFIAAGSWLAKNMGREGGESVMKHLGKQSGRLGSEGLPMDQASRMARAEELGYTKDAYTGSTHDIREFDGSIANPQGDWGRSTYASTSIDDVNANYARSDGADLTSRIASESERVADELSDYPDDLLDEYGFTMDDYLSDEAGIAEAIAKARLVGDASEGVVYPLKINTRDYATLSGDNATVLRQPDFRGEAEGYLDRADYADDWEYEDALNDRMYELMSESEDSLSNRIVEALRNSDAYQNEHEIDAIMEALADDLYDDLYVRDLDSAIRENITDAYDEYTGDLLSSGEISRQVLGNLGFKGVIDNTVNQKFGSGRRYGTGMEGVYPDTEHIITFPSNENTIRSVNAEFDPSKINSSDILAAALRQQQNYV